MAKVYIVKENYRPYKSECIQTIEEARAKIDNFDQLVAKAREVAGDQFRLLTSDDDYCNICNEWVIIRGQQEKRLSEMTKEEPEERVWVYSNIFERHTVKHVRIYTETCMVQIPLISE